MMKKRFFSIALAALLLTGCAEGAGESSDIPSSVSSESEPEGSSSETSGSEESYTPGDRDINGVYVVDGYAARLEYPLNEKLINYAAKRFRYLYDEYLSGKCDNIFVTVVPDKNYFLAEKNGYPALDYKELTDKLTAQMEYAEYLDIFPMLELSDYYYTDTHWKQEKIVDIAVFLAKEMGVTLSAEYAENTVDGDFYGVHCRQADITIDPDKLIYLDNQILRECKVLDGETNKYIDVYNLEQATSDDPYEIFLSGAKSLLTIENPNAATDKELIIFRDSFASSIAPLFAEGYSKITLVDIRYLAPQLLGRFVEFSGQDVLFLYSAPVLNNSTTLK